MMNVGIARDLVDLAKAPRQLTKKELDDKVPLWELFIAAAVENGQFSTTINTPFAYNDGAAAMLEGHFRKRGLSACVTPYLVNTPTGVRQQMSITLRWDRLATPHA